MNFELTEEQKKTKMAAREFAQKEFTRERAMKCELEEEYPQDLFKKAAKLGLICPHFEEEYGGRHASFFETILILEEFFRADITIGHAMSAGSFGIDIIHKFGSEEQKKKYLPMVTRGEVTSAGAFTEPEHGSDITVLSTTAIRDGDTYVINGTKIFITNAPHASFFITLCQTNPKAEPTYRGQSLLLVEKGAEGLNVTKLIGKMGQRAAVMGKVTYNNVRVPKEALVGEENRGFYHLLEFLSTGRTRVAAYGVGIAQGAFDRALEYAKKRVQFGRPIIEFQAIQHKLAKMATQIEAARMLTYRTAWAIDEGKLSPRALSAMASMAKNFAADVSNEVADEAVQIFGGYGYFMELSDVERYYRGARILKIYEGTMEINYNAIADALIREHYKL